jgi:hypothetical protein
MNKKVECHAILRNYKVDSKKEFTEILNRIQNNLLKKQGISLEFKKLKPPLSFNFDITQEELKELENSYPMVMFEDSTETFLINYDVLEDRLQFHLSDAERLEDFVKLFTSFVEEQSNILKSFSIAFKSEIQDDLNSYTLLKELIASSKKRQLVEETVDFIEIRLGYKANDR